MCDSNEQYTVYIVINKIEYWVVIINNMKYIILYNSYQIHINQDDLTVTSNSIIQSQDINTIEKKRYDWYKYVCNHELSNCFDTCLIAVRKKHIVI